MSPRERLYCTWLCPTHSDTPSDAAACTLPHPPQPSLEKRGSKYGMGHAPHLQPTTDVKFSLGESAHLRMVQSRFWGGGKIKKKSIQNIKTLIQIQYF